MPLDPQTMLAFQAMEFCFSGNLQNAYLVSKSYKTSSKIAVLYLDVLVAVSVTNKGGHLRLKGWFLPIQYCLEGNQKPEKSQVFFV